MSSNSFHILWGINTFEINNKHFPKNSGIMSFGYSFLNKPIKNDEIIAVKVSFQ